MKREEGGDTEINVAKFLCSELGCFGNGAPEEALACLQIKVEVNERSRMEKVAIRAHENIGPLWEKWWVSLNPCTEAHTFMLTPVPKWNISHAFHCDHGLLFSRNMLCCWADYSNKETRLDRWVRPAKENNCGQHSWLSNQRSKNINSILSIDN